MANRPEDTKKIIQALGGVAKASRALGLTMPAVSKWVDVPKKHNQKILEITGKTRQEIIEQSGDKSNGDNTG